MSEYVKMSKLLNIIYIYERAFKRPVSQQMAKEKLTYIF